jgi:hypothetical protein
MKRLFVVTLLVMVMSACTRTQQVTAPEEQADQFLFRVPTTTSFVTWEVQVTMAPEKSVAVKIVNTDGSLAKANQCSVPYPATSSRWTVGDFSARWPIGDPAFTNIVIWYFGGVYPPNDQQHPINLGSALLDGVSDCWVGQPQITAHFTLRRRGSDAANFSPFVDGFIDSARRRLLFQYNLGNISPSPAGTHRDVNLDLINVSVSAP